MVPFYDSVTQVRNFYHASCKGVTSTVKKPCSSFGWSGVVDDSDIGSGQWTAPMLCMPEAHGNIQMFRSNDNGRDYDSKDFFFFFTCNSINSIYLLECE